MSSPPSGTPRHKEERMKFKETVRAPRTRPNGQPGFRVFQKGRTPESYGLTPEEIDVLAPLLVEGEGVSADNDDSMTTTEFYEKISKVIRASLKEDPDKENTGIWTKAGIPRVDYLEGMTSMEITETERDIAWDDFKEVN